MTKAVDMLDAYREAMDVLGNPVEDTDFDAQRERAAAFAELAQSESESRFRLLNAHLFLGLWGQFDSSIEELAVLWIERWPVHVSRLNSDEDPRVTLPLTDVLGDNRRERAERAFDYLRSKRHSFGHGVSRFETVLALIGLDGPIPDGLGDQFYEMEQVRNVYAHCGGKADAQFVRNCPHLNMAVGEYVPFDRSRLNVYAANMIAYAIMVKARGWARHGIRSGSWDPGVTVEAVSRAQGDSLIPLLPACHPLRKAYQDVPGPGPDEDTSTV